MCAGAIVNARIPRVVYGASDAKCGACGSVCDIFSMEFNHHPAVTKGVREAEAAGFVNLKGHRTVGGMRASIYNAMPEEGVSRLVEFMADFENKNR